MSDELEIQESDSEGIKSLRKQYEQTAKELKETQARLAEYDQRERRESVAGILKAKGVSPSAAKFYSEDDVSEDAVGKWVEAHADVFGLGKAETNNEIDPNAEAARRVAEASFGATEDRPSIGARVADPEEALRLMQTLPYDELVKHGLVPDPSQLWGAPRR